MFKITAIAQKVLLSVINRDKQYEQEKLYIRLSMGIS
jgi:hypothetical protein